VKVRHYSYSETGGAGRCADALSRVQSQLGIDSEFVYRINADLRSIQSVMSFPKSVLAAGFDEFMVKGPMSPSLFSLNRSVMGVMGPLGQFDLESNDISHLHWIEGMFPRQQLRAAFAKKAKIVWTLHDMAPFTGGCHFSLGCQNYAQDCEGCPQVRAVFRKSVSRNLLDKISVVSSAHLGSLRLVAPSNWLQKAAQESATFKGLEVMVIPNPISSSFFEGYAPKVRPSTGGQESSFVVTVVAEDLANPIKRIDLLLKLVHRLSPGKADRLTLQLVGRNGSKFLRKGGNILAVGPLSPIGLAKIFDTSDLLVSVSSAESAGMTIKEAAARGVPSLVFGAAGFRGTVSHNVNGLIADSENQFVEILESMMDNPNRLKELGGAARDDALKNNQPHIAAGRYLNIYNQLLS
jgi:glycosyltransferase involved in cell wall biosynthesis